MNGHWTGQSLTTTEIHFTGSRPTLPGYRGENSRLNTVFRVGLHSVHKWVFRQSWFQSSASDGASKCRRCRLARVAVVSH